jgi:hypothetical protein
MISSSCASEVALAIGAVMLGRAISQASATCAGVVPTLVATVSSAARTPPVEISLHAGAARTLLEIFLAAILTGEKA